MRDRRNQQLPVALECDEALVEQVVDRGRQQQAVLAIQPFFIGRIAPRLAVAGDQMLGSLDFRDSARVLNLPDVRSKDPLPSPGQDQALLSVTSSCGSC